MRALLDTVAFLYAAVSPENLSGRARSLIENPETVLDLSVVSIVEIAIKAGLGKLGVSPELAREGIERLDLRVLPFTAEHGFALFPLPLHHRDPFDRQLIAQALSEGIAIITPDGSFSLYKGVKVIW